jgi:glutaredoxin
MTESKITIFGTWWCGDCHRVRRFFEQNQFTYNWVDIDKEEQGEKFVLITNHGMRSVPTILFEDGSVMVEPTDIELQSKLQTVFPAKLSS